MAIEAEHYAEARAALKRDPIIIALANELPDDIDTTTWDFMGAAFDEYRRRGGELLPHIGGPAEAITELIKERKPC